MHKPKSKSIMPRMSRTLALCQLSAAAVLTALSCTPAHAEIYHCIVDGVPKFSDKPCHAGDAPVAVPDVTVVPAQKADSLTMQHDARVQQYQKARAEEDADRKSTRLNSSHKGADSRPASA